MNYFEKRVKNIKDNVSLIKVIKDYNLYPFTYEVDDFQMKCPFHGQDNKPSAHVYGKTFTCFACGRVGYDVIEFVKEKEGLEKFVDVLRHIEQKYHLEKVSYDPYEEYQQSDIKEVKTDISIFDFQKLLEKQIISMKKFMEVDKYSKFFYLIDHAANENKMDVMIKVQDKLKELKSKHLK